MGKGPTLPSLGDPYDAAARKALRFVESLTEPAGIVLSGTIVRGQAQANSDLDFVVVHHSRWRQRTQRRFDGVPIEIFINPPDTIRGYFEPEQREGRPVTAHMLHTGTVVTRCCRT